MEKHFRTLGWIHLVGSVAWLVLASVGFVVSLVQESVNPPKGTIYSPDFGVGFLINVYITAIVPGAVVALNGRGLLRRRPWARGLTIALSAVPVTAVLLLRGRAVVGALLMGGRVDIQLLTYAAAPVLVAAIPVYGLWAMLRPGSAAAWAAYVSRRPGPTS
jgi:hypothetical protein